jgi:hypothetical protein
MSLRMFRGVWVTLCNAVLTYVIASNVVGVYRLRKLVGGVQPPRPVSETWGPLILIAVLLLGVLVEWINWTRLALAINAGFFAFLGFGVVINAVRSMVAKPAIGSEAGQVLAVVGIPCSIIAVADFVLYWLTRPNRPLPAAVKRR